MCSTNGRPGASLYRVEESDPILLHVVARSQVSFLATRQCKSMRGQELLLNFAGGRNASLLLLENRQEEPQHKYE